MSAVARPLKTPAARQTPDAANAKSAQGRARRWFGRAAREPFFQFLLLGLLISAGLDYSSTERDRYVIQLGPAERERIIDTYAQQFGQPPTAEQLKGLIDRYIREEIYWREGLGLKLDQNDEIVRRRIVQKYEFLQTNLGVMGTPDEKALQQWFERHKANYLSPKRTAFTHVYFSVDRLGEQAARARAVNALEQLRARRLSRAADQGDAFPGPTDVSALASDEAERLLGHSQLTREIFKLPIGQWSGPLRSGYGWHLVYVTGRSPPVLPSWADIRPRVLADYQDEQRRLSNARRLEALKAKYTIGDEGVRRR